MIHIYIYLCCLVHVLCGSKKKVSFFFNIPKSGTKLDIILAESSKKTRNARMLFQINMCQCYTMLHSEIKKKNSVKCMLRNSFVKLSLSVKL